MEIEFYESSSLVNVAERDGESMASLDSGARMLSRLECSHTIRPSKPGEAIEYNACQHDYTLCNNLHCIKKLV